MPSLNVKQVAAFKGPGRLGDGNGLHLVAKREGCASWLFLFVSPKTGKRREMGLGSTAEVSLAQARATVAALREHIRAGHDPIDDREAHAKRIRDDEAKRQAVPIFGVYLLDYLATHKPGWKNAKHRAQWESTLKTHAAPLHALRVNEITTSDVLAVIKPLWQTIPETASRLRGRIESILSAAKAAGLRTGENPAAWKDNLEHLLPPRKRLTRGHQRSLSHTGVAAFMTALRAQDSVGARCLEFLTLTVARASEAAGCRWDEIDEAGKVWKVPGARMKEGREHRQPLTPRALEIVRMMKIIRQNNSPFVFPGLKGGHLCIAALTNVLKRLDFHTDTCTHGLRATFKGWADTTAFKNDHVELTLSHTIGNNVENAYRRDKLLVEERRPLLSAWTDYCAGKTNIVEMPTRSAA